MRRCIGPKHGCRLRSCSQEKLEDKARKLADKLSPDKKTGKSETRVPTKVTVSFGEVKVAVTREASKSEVKRNIEEGQIALARAKATIIKRGVTLAVAKGVSLYHADPQDSNLVVRIIGKKRERGEFVNGEFRKIGR
jgi:hypothetical protein